MAGTLFVVSAPSGAGKTTLLAEVLPQSCDLDVSISYTTRGARPSEEHGNNYFFISQDKFKDMQSQDLFLESAEVFGNFYGTSKDWVESHLSKDRDVVLEIDWQGAVQVKEKFPDAVLVFIVPPSYEHLASRLKTRAQDAEEVQKMRLSQAKLEMSKYKSFDYIVVNDDFSTACNDLIAIFRSSRLKLSKQKVRLASLFKDLIC